MNSDNPELDYLYARQFAYDVLRRLLMEEPTVELLIYLRDEGLSLFPVDGELPAIEGAITAMKQDLQTRELQAGTDGFENLHWDFTRLFIGPDSPPAAPWESTYVSRDKLLFQQCTLDVKTFYQKNGFNLPKGDVEAADHIGYELDFLWNLSERALQIFENESEFNDPLFTLLRTSNDFMEAHLLAFITPFCRELNNHAETEFYRQLSTLLEVFLRNDVKKINKLLIL
ncbi:MULTISPECIES: TorD/DmsD family molecular chaperone [Providencia]|uniref:TorD/DmsD family molecular chaperone n=1 Tax=Providencia TaxID=586 RepID=UPI000839271A|nr:MULTISPECIES: molecular chaperone TorD family protein [Providencia]MBP6121192.1 molecular chaperone TorD family protein [Providencia sp.]NIH22915.1 molecular chaperone TorD family protein [Providencia heimbachae]QCJ70306.1 molecular chaperone TorD [Providencia heimbachae]